MKYCNNESNWWVTFVSSEYGLWDETPESQEGVEEPVREIKYTN